MTKANFDGIYTSASPRPYYRTLGEHDYEIPAHSGAVFRQLAEAIAEESPPSIVDLCCSYGVNATTLNHDLDFVEVLDHYRDQSTDHLAPADTAARDRDWFEAHRVDDPIRICGVDSAAPAIEYARDVGLIDAGHAEDLETNPPSEGLVAELEDADLVTVSGGIGYITERTVSQVLHHVRRPRLAALCLRWIDFAPIVDVGAEFGLVTERLDEATFPQRRFVDPEERDHVHSELADLGVDTDGRETEGRHHCDLYLLRPAAEVQARPLTSFLDPNGAIGQDGGRIDGNHDLDASVFTSGTDLR